MKKPKKGGMHHRMEAEIDPGDDPADWRAVTPAAPHRVLRQADYQEWLESALDCYEAGSSTWVRVCLDMASRLRGGAEHNKRHGYRDSRRGRPPGAHNKHDPNALMMAWMDAQAAEIGERPQRLARLAIEAGLAGKVRPEDRQNKIRQIGDKWKRRRKAT